MRFLDTSRIRTRLDCRFAADDGTILSVDLYLPPLKGRYPLLLTRTASDNNRAGRAGVSKAPAERWKILAAQGFIVAASDVRGRGDSDGAFIPFQSEEADGGATIDWLRGLDEADGRIGLFGSGYAAFCAWAAALSRPVEAIASLSPFGGLGSQLPHRRGMLRLDWLFWMHLVGGRSVQPADLPPWREVFEHRPIASMADALGRDDIWWADWIRHADPSDAYWDCLRLEARIARLDVPALHVTGWFDGNLAAARGYYAASSGRRRQDVIVGPWDSAAVRRPHGQVGGFEFGPRAAIDVDEALASFFRAHLSDPVSPAAATSPAPLDFDREAPRARLFVTGRNEWLETAEWEDPAAAPTALYLTSQTGANTRRGDGRLEAAVPPARTDTLTDNPDVPVLFQAQFRSFAAAAMPAGLQLDQAHITGRDEALVYTGEAYSQPSLLSGAAELRLVIRTDAPDADVIVLLSDCFPAEARDLHLAYDSLRLGSLPDFAAGELIEVTFRLGPLAHEFQPGHRLRLTIVPSLFPLYASNLHQPNYLDADAPRLAVIEIGLGGERPSRLCLPEAGRGGPLSASGPNP